METGQAFRERRETLGISQEQVAAKADMASATIRNFEAGKPVRTSTARRIIEALRAIEREELADEDRPTEDEIARRLAKMNDDDVAAYMLSLSAEESDRLVARILNERARQGSRRAGSV